MNTLNECKSSIQTIYLSWDHLDDKCMKSLGEFIKNNQTINNIDIGFNKITDKGIEILLPYLIGNIAINKIDISYNEGITNKSVPLLLEIIQKSNIEDIKINGTSKENKNTIVIPLVENILKNGSDKIYMNWK